MRKFEVVKGDKPKSRLFDKLTIEATPTAPLIQSEPEKAVEPVSRTKKIDPVKKPKSAPRDNNKLGPTSKPTRAKARFVIGIPKHLEGRFVAACDKASIDPAYALASIVAKISNHAESIDIPAMKPCFPIPEMVGNLRTKWVFVDQQILDDFKRIHDPLNGSKTVDYFRQIYIAAFSEALTVMEGSIV